MSRLGYCLPCGERGEPVDATVVIDGDPMCNLCVRMAAKASAPVVPPQAEPEAQPEPIPPLATGCWRKLVATRHAF